MRKRPKLYHTLVLSPSRRTKYENSKLAWLKANSHIHVCAPVMSPVVLLEFTHIQDCAPAVLRQSRVLRESLYVSRKNPNCSSDGLTPAATILDSGWHWSLWGGHYKFWMWASFSFRIKRGKRKYWIYNVLRKIRGSRISHCFWTFQRWQGEFLQIF